MASLDRAPPTTSDDHLTLTTISPGMISSLHSTPTLTGDSPGINSPVAMLPAQDTSFTDFTTLPENDCAACKKQYTILCVSNDFFCDDCRSILQGNEPKTDQEIELENVVRNFSDDDLRAVGLGRFFELENPATAASPQPNATVPPARQPSSSHEAQNSAVRSQIMHQRNISGSNIPSPRLSTKAPSASPMPPPESQVRTRAPPARNLSSREAQMSALNSQLMHQRKTSGNNLPRVHQSSEAPSASPMPSFHPQIRDNPPSDGMTRFPTGPAVTQDFLRQWAFTHHSGETTCTPAATASHGRTSSAPIPQSVMDSPGAIFGSPSMQAQTRKKGKRMICATCNKDSPVDRKKNDGVNCTRCYQKLMKSAATSSALPEMNGGKRPYESAFDGYSPADGSPSKRPK